MEINERSNIEIDPSALQIEIEIGSGGYGVVFRGKWNQYTDVAIKKFFQKDLNEDVESEFLKEVQIMQTLRHPNIISFYGYCINPTGIVVELMKCSLFQFLHSKQEISIDLKLQIAQEIAAGLTYLHNCNIIHRDLKSANILLNELKNAKICDFGLARVKKMSKSLSTKKQVGTIR